MLVMTALSIIVARFGAVSVLQGSFFCWRATSVLVELGSTGFCRCAPRIIFAELRVG